VDDALIEEQAQARGLKVDAARAREFDASLNSLLARLRHLGELLPRGAAPPPNRAPG